MSGHWLDEAITAKFAGDARSTTQKVNRISQAGQKCQRRLLWNRTRPHDAVLGDDGLQRYFWRGNVFEPAIRRLVEDSGLQVDQAQRDVWWPAFELSGHIDGLVHRPDDEKAVWEVKSVSRFMFDSVRKSKTAVELLARNDYVSGYVTQNSLYAMAMDTRFGVLTFLCTDTAETVSFDIDILDDEILKAVEEPLQRWALVNEAIRRGEDLPGEPDLHCQRCPFLGSCAPMLKFSGEIRVMEDPEVEQMVLRRIELSSAASEHAKLSKDLVETFGAAGEFVIGRAIVKVKAGTRTEYDYPDDVKEKYGRKVPSLTRKYDRAPEVKP